MNKLAWNLIAYNLEYMIREAMQSVNVIQRTKLIAKLKASRKQLDTAIEFLEQQKENK